MALGCCPPPKPLIERLRSNLHHEAVQACGCQDPGPRVAPRGALLRRDLDVFTAAQEVTGAAQAARVALCTLRLAVLGTGAGIGGTHPTVSGLARDVTRRRFLDRALQETNVALERARFVQAQTSHAKAEQMVLIGEQLRTWLQAMGAWAEVVQAGGPAPAPSSADLLSQPIDGLAHGPPNGHANGHANGAHWRLDDSVRARHEATDTAGGAIPLI